MNVHVQQRVLKIMAEVLNQKESDVNLDASLKDLQMDSLQQMTLFIALEDEFLLSLPQEEVTGLGSVKEIISLVDKKLQESPPA